MTRKIAARVLALAFLAVAATPGLARGVEKAQGEFTADLPAGGELRVHVRSGETRIVGSDGDRMTVRYEGRNAFRSNEVKVSLARSGRTGYLTVKGGPKNGLCIILEIPRQTNLYVRMPFGDLSIASVIGDKDIAVHAGDMTVEVGEASQYSRVDASVYAGDLDARGFGVDKGGLFRSFETVGQGRYRLHAHLGAGQLTLK